MKTLILKENRLVYETTLDESLRQGEPVILERDEQPVAALVSIIEYEAFRTWRARQTMPPPNYDWPMDRTIEEVVADIKRRGPGLPNVRPATASLAELLANASPPDPNFDLAEWEREWAKAEAEIEANDRLA